MTISVSSVIALNDDPCAATRFYGVAFNTDVKPNATELNIGGLDFRFVQDSARELTPAVSFMVRFPAGQEDKLHDLWTRLMSGSDTVGSGTALMPLSGYDFSPLFGWLADGYGVNWQLMILPTGTAAADTGAETDDGAGTNAAGGAGETKPGESGTEAHGEDLAKPDISVVPYFMWTGDEPQAQAATEVYNDLFGEGNFMTLDSPGMHRFTFGDGVAMHLTSFTDTNMSASDSAAATNSNSTDASSTDANPTDANPTSVTSVTLVDSVTSASIGGGVTAADELSRARRALGLTDTVASSADLHGSADLLGSAALASATDIAGSPEPKPQPDRFGVFWV